MVLFEDLNERLAKVKNQQRKKRKWEEQITDYETELQKKQQASAALRSTMEEHKEDIEKLEEISFIHLLAVLTGSTDERMREKRYDIATAKLKYDESQHAISQIQDSINHIQEKINTLPNIDQEYQHILEEKEQLIEDSRSLLSRRYSELSENVADLQSFLTETTEAIRAGEKVNDPLNEAIEKLKKAKGWGGFDLFGGGGFAAYNKYNHIDDAKESIHAAQIKMRLFHKELLDIHHESDLDDLDVEISGLLTFADFVFDGIFVDSIVLEEIEDSLKQTEDHKKEVDKLLLHLNFRYNLKQKELNRLQKKQEKLLEEYGA